MCVHTQVRVCVCTCNCHQLNGVWGVGPPKSLHIILEVLHPPLNVDTPQWDLHCPLRMIVCISTSSPTAHLLMTQKFTPPAHFSFLSCMSMYIFWMSPS